jgi:hypothetical protein
LNLPQTLDLVSLLETFAKLHKTSNFVIPAKAGIQTPESIPLPSFPRKRESSIDFMVPRLREDSA